VTQPADAPGTPPLRGRRRLLRGTARWLGGLALGFAVLAAALGAVAVPTARRPG
jgi:hypothetical protein